MNAPAGAASAGAGPWSRLWCLAPAIALGVVTLPYLYRDCVGDPDTLLMLNGVLELPARADQLNPWHKYGVLFSWGYYWLLYHLPAHVREHSSSLIAAANGIGWASTVLTCATLGWLAQRLYGLGVSLALTIPVAFSPMVLELATYGHPFMLSAALLFGAGIVLIEAESGRGIAALAARTLSTLLAFASLSVRAETLLALPWLALVSPREDGSARIRRVVSRGLWFAAAFAAFLSVQRSIVSGHGVALASLAAFFRSFYHAGGVVRGLVVLVLGSGVALVAATPAVALWGRLRRIPARSAAPALVLLGIMLLFWLPNPAPARHFFFALVALSEMLALGAVPLLGARRAVGLAIAVVVLNQAGAELLYGPISRSYWPGDQGSRRLATGSVPLGASLPYHAAMQSTHASLRQEGRRLARVPDPEVIFFGDAPDYLILALLERGGPRTWEHTLEAGFHAERIQCGGQTFHIVVKNGYRPRDVAAEYLAEDPFPDAKIFVQPSTRSQFDRTPIPPERLLILP